MDNKAGLTSRIMMMRTRTTTTKRSLADWPVPIRIRFFSGIPKVIIVANAPLLANSLKVFRWEEKRKGYLDR